MLSSLKDPNLNYNNYNWIYLSNLLKIKTEICIVPVSLWVVVRLCCKISGTILFFVKKKKLFNLFGNKKKMISLPFYLTESIIVKKINFGFLNKGKTKRFK